MSFCKICTLPILTTVLTVLLTVPVQTLAVITFRLPRHCGTAALRKILAFEIKNILNYVLI
nr:MAG TPA: hypothetical protein [Caudoviricetes sp.]